MKKKTVRYTDNPELGRLKIIPDFLPPPEALRHAEEIVHVKVPLTKRSMDFFTQKAKEQKKQLQTVIKQFLDVRVTTR